MKKIALFIATKKGYGALQGLLKEGLKEQIAFVCSFREVDVFDSYTQSIMDLCKEQAIPYYDWNEVKSDISCKLKEHGSQMAFAISWKYIIPLSINEVLEVPFIVFHDSLLPRYRGFAPTPTAILNGESEVGYTALFAEDEMDSGDIILQEKISLTGEEYVGEVIDALSARLAPMICTIVRRAQEGKLTAAKQEENDITYSVWRDLEDCKIDWNRSAKEIYALIRAVSKPYLGAYTYMEGKKIIIHKAVLDEEVKFEIRYPGKLWRIKNQEATVICKEGMLRILEAKYEDGTAVLFKKLRCRLG